MKRNKITYPILYRNGKVCGACTTYKMTVPDESVLFFDKAIFQGVMGDTTVCIDLIPASMCITYDGMQYEYPSVTGKVNKWMLVYKGITYTFHGVLTRSDSNGLYIEVHKGQ